MVVLLSVMAFSRLNDLGAVALPCAIGAAAVFLLLPRPQGSRNALLGGLLGGLALLVGVFLLLRTGVLSPETVLFYTFAALAIVGGVLLVTQRNPARAALSFALVVLSTCGLFLLLAAPFLMAATIIIYAGAIIVTFLFVLMLASQAGITDADARTREPLLATALGFLLLGCLVYVLQVSYENETAHEINKLLADTEQAGAQINADNRSNYHAWPKHLKDHFDKAISTGAENRTAVQTKEMQYVRDTMDRDFQRSEWPLKPEEASMDDLKKGLMSLEHALVRIRQQHGWLPPLTDSRPHGWPAGGTHLRTASDLSGPSAIEPAMEWRYDDQGRPHLPAENSAFLGRSLFTDFLLPVELGGVLLLVATIGAVAIAHRTPPTARAS
jgi:NADH:ubiquinone oxidoreductase subunit 6 (subunit J)